MKIMYDTLDVIGDQLVHTLENATKLSNDVEMHEWVARFTTDVISNVAFGLNSDSLNDENSKMRKYGKKCLEFNLIKFYFTSSFPEFSRKLHLTANQQSVIDFFYNTFKSNIESREKSHAIRKDFLQILLELKKSSTLSVSELAAESFIFFLGGNL
jgi:cytochrome P450 family 6